jgi:hypothetical protein
MFFIFYIYYFAIKRRKGILAQNETLKSIIIKKNTTTYQNTVSGGVGGGLAQIFAYSRFMQGSWNLTPAKSEE